MSRRRLVLKRQKTEEPDAISWNQHLRIVEEIEKKHKEDLSRKVQEHSHPTTGRIVYTESEEVATIVIERDYRLAGIHVYVSIKIGGGRALVTPFLVSDDLTTDITTLVTEGLVDTVEEAAWFIGFTKASHAVLQALRATTLVSSDTYNINRVIDQYQQICRSRWQEKIDESTQEQ